MPDDARALRSQIRDKDAEISALRAQLRELTVEVEAFRSAHGQDGIVDLDVLDEKLEYRVRGEILVLKEMSHRHFFEVQKLIDEYQRRMTQPGSENIQWLEDQAVEIVLRMYAPWNESLTAEFLSELTERQLGTLLNQGFTWQQRILFMISARNQGDTGGPPASAPLNRETRRAAARGARSTKR